MKIVDTRGEKCPKPIIETRKALKETSPGEVFNLLTDSNTSFKNVSRYLTDNGIGFSVAEKAGVWTFTITNGTGGQKLTEAEQYCETEVEQAPRGDFAVAVSSEFMGSGDDELGKRLIKAFFVSVSCLDKLPSFMAFYNSGVKLASDDSGVIDILKEIEAKGVEMILCGTCVDHFKLNEKTAVGKIGDMFQILQKLSASGNVIRP